MHVMKAKHILFIFISIFQVNKWFSCSSSLRQSVSAF